MWILIDDQRNGDYDVIFRNGESAIWAMRAFKEVGLKVEHLAIDHDLGKGMDGYSVMISLEKFDLIPEQVTIVSSNPVGVKNIGALLKADGYGSNNGRTWRNLLK